MENATPECSLILEPLMKQGSASGKEYKIPEKRERYSVEGVERLGDLHNYLGTIIGWGIAHGEIEGKIGERPWKRKFRGGFLWNVCGWFF